MPGKQAFLQINCFAIKRAYWRDERRYYQYQSKFAGTFNTSFYIVK
ncbi:hypothetical protein DAQ1742_02429 [Dickeya aquatica]|uniref:Uncharacterized protein n=1 Tax=Dickeya aquatica TaxID=1401087 RepID=A0A375ABG8_9GAMM|nr:hypothetical protein DAQ1742_02429 [Dickeya aquatica]